MEAISDRDVDGVRQALAAGADPNQADPHGWTPLTDAVLARRPEIVRLLLEAGARVAAEAGRDSTCLHEAAEIGDVEILELLLAVDGTAALEHFDYLNRTPLICAAATGSIDAARLLLAAGADVNARNEPQAGETALHHAVERNDPAMVEFLLKAGADPLAPGWMWLTPRHRAESCRRDVRPQIQAMIEQALAPGGFRDAPVTNRKAKRQAARTGRKNG